MHYTQILLILTSFDLKIVQDFGSGLYQIGSPIFSYTEIINCYLVQLESKTNIAHIYLSFFMDIAIFFGILILFIIYFSFKNKKNQYMRNHYKFTTILLVFLWFSPLIFRKGIKLLLCRKVGDSYYVSENLLYECSDSHI